MTVVGLAFPMRTALMIFVIQIVRINILTPPRGCSLGRNGERRGVTMSVLFTWVVGGWHCPVLRGLSPKFIPCFHSRKDLVPPVPLILFALVCVGGF